MLHEHGRSQERETPLFFFAHLLHDAVRFPVSWSPHFSFSSSFSTVSTPIFATKASFVIVLRALHLFLCTSPTFHKLCTISCAIKCKIERKERRDHRESDINPQSIPRSAGFAPDEENKTWRLAGEHRQVQGEHRTLNAFCLLTWAASLRAPRVELAAQLAAHHGIATLREGARLPRC